MDVLWVLCESTCVAFLREMRWEGGGIILWYRYKLTLNYEVLYFTNYVNQAVSRDGRWRSARRYAIGPWISLQASQINVLQFLLGSSLAIFNERPGSVFCLPAVTRRIQQTHCVLFHRTLKYSGTHKLIQPAGSYELNCQTKSCPCILKG
jgi:hypothetical protein